MRTDRFLFLIAFNGVSSKFIVSIPDMGKTIKEHSKNGIAKIKIYNDAKESFGTLSRARLKLIVDYDTSALTELQKANYIK